MTAYDARTVEAAAKVAEDFASAWETSPLVLEARAAGTGARSIAAAIRALPVSLGTTTGEASEPSPLSEEQCPGCRNPRRVCEAESICDPGERNDIDALVPTPSDTLGETVEKLREDLASLNIREGEEWYALIGKGYDLCLESARFQPDHPNAAQNAIVGRFACGAYAIRCLSVVARAMNALPTLLTALEQRQEGWLPIENIPDDVLEALLYWPALKLDEDDNLTDEPAGVPGLVGRGTRFSAKHGWDECEAELGASGHYFGDPWEFGHPTHWRPLPTPPLPMKED